MRSLAAALVLVGCWRGQEPMTERTDEPRTSNEWQTGREAPIDAGAADADQVRGMLQSPPNPVCDVMVQQALHYSQIGQHRDALIWIEDAVACDPHPHYVQLAFVHSCNACNSPNAKHYYKRLTPSQQTRYAAVCIRQKPPVAYQ